MDLSDRLASVTISDDVWAAYVKYFEYANQNCLQPGYLTVQGLVALNLLAVGQILVYKRKKTTTNITVKENPNVVLSVNGFQSDTPSGILRRIVGKPVTGAWSRIKTSEGTTLEELRNEYQRQMDTRILREIRKVIPDAWELSAETQCPDNIYRVMVFTETPPNKLQELRSSNVFFKSKYVVLKYGRNPPAQFDGGDRSVEEGAAILKDGLLVGSSFFR